MHSDGILNPTTETAVRERYGAVGGTAQTVVRSTTKAMSFDRSEYDERVTTDVISTAHEALFGSLLEVMVGTAEEFDRWCDDHNHEVELIGSETVDNVVFHPVEFESVVVGATYQQKERAAIETLRRHAFGKYYRPVIQKDD
ncbi:DUF5809 family protein [Halocatena halophila]|uniref:DUF5809 family protein n=1 Tax=Halocatena halophila TaxID=2814576 RepID=UPI002ED3D749